jgi:hypothetical protein
MTLKTLFILALLIALVSAVPIFAPYHDTIGQVCFNISPSVTMTGSNASIWYGIMNVSLPQNTTFWNGSLMAYHPGTGTDVNVFNFANSTTDEYFILPTVTTITAGTKDVYCIYVNGTSKNDLATIAPYGLGFDTSFSVTKIDIFSSTVNYSATWNNGTVTINTSGRTGVRYNSSSGLAATDIIMFSKFRLPITTGTGGILFNPITNLNIPYFGTVGDGVGLYNSSVLRSHWYSNITGEYIYPYNSSWFIYSHRVDGLTPYYENTTMFDENMSFINKTTGVDTLLSGFTQRSAYLAYVENSSVEYDWSVAGFYPHNQTLTVSDTYYDMQDGDIHFISPTWGSSWSIEDFVSVSMHFDKAYDTCNLSIHDDVQHTFVPGAGDTVTEDIDMGAGVDGGNWLTVNCSLGGILSHRYHYIQRAGSASSAIFETAFGLIPSEMGCNTTEQIQLQKCYEGYNLSEIEDFAAVVCEGINTAVSFSCLHTYGIHNVTKNGYTIFYRPEEYLYPGYSPAPPGHAAINVQHVGADFIYGATLEPGFELLPANATGTDHPMFVFIPAQDKGRDCGIYYSSSTLGCSWGYGFVLNQGTIILSDRNNDWFTAAGMGVEPYNINYSQQVPAVTVYPIIKSVEDVFPDGIFTRLNCYVDGFGGNSTNYEIKVKNTLLQNYTLLVTSNTTVLYNDTTQSFQYYKTIPMAGVTNITLYVDDRKICQYGGETNLFLPFVMPTVALIPAGFNVIVMAMMIFMTVLTSIVPFAVILVIIWNDIYHVLNISQVALICILSMLFGFVNSSFNMERGIKHMLIILGITTAYLAAVSPYAGNAGIELNGFDDTINAFNDLRASNDIGTFVFGIPQFVINLFILLLLLPVTFVNFILAMLYYISPVLWTAAQRISWFITVGIVIYFYLKAYEVLSNRFRPV